MDAWYDACGCSPMGKLSQQSLPHASGASQLTWTVFTYDGLGRTKYSEAGRVTAADGRTLIAAGNVTSYNYAGNTVKVTDPAGNWKTFTMDAFGNLIQVDEPDPQAGTVSTIYGYDALNHIISVNMTRGGYAQTRTFNYVTASGTLSARLLSATNPENGTVTYTYNGDGTLATKKDAKNQTLKYAYDTYGRLLTVSLAGSPDTVLRTFTYDTNSADSNYSQYAQGRLTTETYTVPAVSHWTDGSNDRNYTLTSDTVIEMYSYNRAGQVTGKRMRITTSADDQGRTASDDVNATWSYDSEGRLASVIYPADANPQMPPQSYKYAYNGLGQLSGMTDSNNYDASLVSGVLYNPAGQLTQMNSTWFNETRQYNTLNQLTNITDKSGATTVTNITYNYPAAGQNNGKIASQTDAITGETVTYAYDSLNRLISAQSGSTWGQGFQYDGFGNLTAKTVLAGSVPTLSVGIDGATNHMIGQSYDANGNMLSSPMGQTLAYDAENRLTSTTSGSSRVSYAYDGQNKRIWSCQWDPDAQQCVHSYSDTTERFYFYGPDGKLLATMSPTYFPASRGQNGQTIPPSLKVYGGGPAYFGGRMLGAEDRLGSHGRYYPYGEDRDSDLAQKNPGDGGFTYATYMRDSATGLNYADQRYYAAGWGRFATPDPYGHANITSPQDWNQYSYTQGEPINANDPLGLCAVMIAGLTMDPGSMADWTGKAGDLTADTAYPYSGQNFAQGAVSVYSQGNRPNDATMAALSAILYALASNSGSIDIIAYSGGAGAFTAAYSMLTPYERSRIGNILYIAPSANGTLASNASTNVVVGSGLFNDFLTATLTMPIGMNPQTSNCEHTDLSCLFKAAASMMKTIQVDGSCNAPEVFTRTDLKGVPGVGIPSRGNGGGVSPGDDSLIFVTPVYYGSEGVSFGLGYWVYSWSPRPRLMNVN